jgi:hypothetical protein
MIAMWVIAAQTDYVLHALLQKNLKLSLIKVILTKWTHLY